MWEWDWIISDRDAGRPGAVAGFLCPLTANTYDVEFLAFKIRDAETGKVGPPRLLALRHLVHTSRCTVLSNDSQLVLTVAGRVGP